MAQNVGILGGTVVARRFASNMMIMFVGPWCSVVAMAAYAFILDDQVLPTKPARMNLRE